jgi:hypothetical protein
MQVVDGAAAPASRNNRHSWLWVPAQGRDDVVELSRAKHGQLRASHDTCVTPDSVFEHNRASS